MNNNEEKEENKNELSKNLCLISSSQEEYLRHCPFAFTEHESPSHSNEEIYRTPPEGSLLPTSDDQNPDNCCLDDDAIDSGLKNNSAAVDLSSDDEIRGGIDLNFDYGVRSLARELSGSGSGSRGDTEFVGVGRGLNYLKRRGCEIERGVGNKRGKILDDLGLDLGLGAGFRGDTEVIGSGCGNLGSGKGDGEEGGLLSKKTISDEEFDKQKDKVFGEGSGLGKVDSCVDGDTEVMEEKGVGNVESSGMQGVDDEADKLGKKMGVEEFDKQSYLGELTRLLSLPPGMKVKGVCGSILSSVVDSLNTVEEKHKLEHDVLMNERMSIFDKAESVGLTFPRPRWWPAENFPEVIQKGESSVVRPNANEGNKRAEIPEKDLGVRLGFGQDAEVIETGGVSFRTGEGDTNVVQMQSDGDGEEGRLLDKNSICDIQGFNKQKGKVFEEGLGKVDMGVDGDMEFIEEGDINAESSGMQGGDSKGDRSCKKKNIEEFNMRKYLGALRTLLLSSSSSRMKGRGGGGAAAAAGLSRVLPRSFFAPEDDMVAPTETGDNAQPKDEEICLVDLLRIVEEKRKLERGASTNEKMSIFETAEDVGLTFPRPRWWPPNGFPEGGKS